MGYKLKKPDYFNLRDISYSGQCFRFNYIGEDKYSTIYKDNYIELKDLGEELEVSCNKKTWENIWVKYFDLDTDYSKYEEVIKNLGSEYDYIKKAFEYSKGIRILRQDSFEMLISYIISQRNRIPKIKDAVERLSLEFGRELRDKFTGNIFYTFPNEMELSPKVEDYMAMKLGYRDTYVARAVQDVRERGIEYFSDFDKVKILYGVGEKVANCYLLFGRHDIARFPVDVWIKKILVREFDEHLDLTPFKEFAGIVQQYMFYYERMTSLA